MAEGGEPARGPAREPARGPRWRIDGFTPEKRRVFLAALGKYGTVRDAARVAGVSRTTVDRHRRKWPDFAKACETARLQAAGPLEAIAWERAVNGAEQTIVRKGEVVEVRKKPSDGMLRMLLQSSDPDRFGRTGGATPRQIEALKARLRAEVEAELRGTPEEQAARGRALREEVEAKLAELHRRFCSGVDCEECDPPEGEEEDDAGEASAGG